LGKDNAWRFDFRCPMEANDSTWQAALKFDQHLARGPEWL
jgi:hypothetical protein